MSTDELTGTDLTALEEEQCAAIVHCEQAGCCRLATVPGVALDRLAAAFSASGRSPYGICCTHRSVATMESAGFAAALLDQVVREVLNGPDQPFERPAVTSYKTLIPDWIKHLAVDPAPLLALLGTRGVSVVIAPDGALLTGAVCSVLARLAAEGLRVVIAADPRATTNAQQWALGEATGHVHEITVSATRSPEVAAALCATEAAKRHGLVMHAAGPRGVTTTTDVYKTREQLIVALGTALARIPGLAASKDAALLGAGAPSCELGIEDLRGESVLIVAPRANEAIKLARQLGNYVGEAPVILGEFPGWREKLQQLSWVLDPLGEENEAFVGTARVGVEAIQAIAYGCWRRVNGRMPLPMGFMDDLFGLDKPTGAGLPSSASGAGGSQARYAAVVQRAVSSLDVVLRRGSPVEARAAARIIDTLRRHLVLIEDESQDQVARLVDLAHEIFDLRALGFIQAASGSQRWYPRPATYRARGGERLAVAAELYRARKARRRPTPELVAPDGAGALFVSYIQHLGHDVADRVVICRTLRHHMPCTGRNANAEYEEAIFYRAAASARRSLHLLSVDMSPYLLPPVRDHRREATKS